MVVWLPVRWEFDSLPGRFSGFGHGRWTCGRWVGVGSHVSEEVCAGCRRCRPGLVSGQRWELSSVLLEIADGGQERGDRAGLWRVLGNEQPRLAGACDEFPCGGEESISPPFHIPTPCSVSAGQGRELKPSHQAHGQSNDTGPGLVGVAAAGRRQHHDRRQVPDRRPGGPAGPENLSEASIRRSKYYSHNFSVGTRALLRR